MDFGLSDTQRLLRDEIGGFVEDTIVGTNDGWDDAENFPTDVYDSLAEMGILGMYLPEAAGGEDLDKVEAGIVYEQLGRGDVGLAVLAQVQNSVNSIVYRYGTDEQRDLAVDNAAGGVGFCFGLTEPGAGSDASAIETVARRNGDGWTFDGTKTAISGATLADYCLLFAREEGADQIRPFLIPMDAEGVEVQPYDGMGCRVSGWGQIFLTGASAPASARLTEESGFRIAIENFNAYRAWIALYCLGAAQQTIDETVQYLEERETFGRPLASRQGPRFEVAEMQALVECARWKTYQALWLADQGQDFVRAASIAKWFGCKVSKEVIHDCMLLHGHFGYSSAFPIEQRLRDVVGLEIADGPPQIQKRIVANEIFG